MYELPDLLVRDVPTTLSPPYSFYPSYMHLHTKIPKVVNIWASKCIMCKAYFIFELKAWKIKHLTWLTIHNTQNVQSIKRFGCYRVSVPILDTFCPHFWTKVHSWREVDKRLQSDGSEMGSQGPSATYKSWSSTNPGDNPQIQHLKYRIQITTQNQLEENKKLRLITIKYKYK